MMMMGFEILILGLIVWAAVTAVNRQSRDGAMRPASSPSAKETLDGRLARGEINLDEYRRLRETLETQTLSSAS
ncbi:MAG TPA: hypothetical protein VFI11_02370 [Anaerolineales bacterium]|nr:hypothetical protein [Anaerolineales bacterium]